MQIVCFVLRFVGINRFLSSQLDWNLEFSLYHFTDYFYPMRIAFDAKRAFHNGTGLGQYSRNLLNALIEGYPQHEYYLATPKPGGLYHPPQQGNVHTMLPSGVYKTFASLWRSSGIRHDLKELGIELFHGLSHEIPVGLKGIKTVVTMHDLIFERYPQQYKAIDVAVYRKKFKYACKHADIVIAISRQTADDLQEFYKVPADKIRICYQSCNPAFAHKADERTIERVREKYSLPHQYLLSVGSIIERKNLLSIVKALYALKDSLDIPLAVIGKGSGAYYQQVKHYIQQHNMGERVLFLSDRNGGVDGDDMPAIYQGAHINIYPSVFEGFGIPILESLWSGVPVITSNVSCMPETGGDAAYYINPLSVDEMANGITEVASNQALRAGMIAEGLQHAQKFTPARCAGTVMQVYESLV